MTNVALQKKNRGAKPVLKWAGGKSQMLDLLYPLIPRKYNKYIEPFFGGGALFFAVLPAQAVIADSNPEIINLYQVISVDVESLIESKIVFKTVSVQT